MSQPAPTAETAPAAASAPPLDLCGWRVLPELNMLQREGHELRVEPRVMQVLACLLRAQNAVVTRDRLIELVWGHPHVTEDAVNRTVSKLRKVLAEDMECAVQVETLPKVGYRLVTGAGPVPEAPVVAPPPPRRIRPVHLIAGGAVALAALALALDPFGMLRPRAASPPTGETRLVPLTTLPGHEIQATLSPDGSHVAFAWKSAPGDDWDIYTRPVDSEALQPVTNHPGKDLRPAWSPSGRELAFLRIDAEQCAVYIGAPFGGAARRVADCDPEHENLAWAPDGKSLAFTLPGRTGLSLIRLSDGAVSVLTLPPEQALGDSDPAFSADGLRVAFTRWRAIGVGDVHLQAVGQPQVEPRRLTFDNLKIHGLTWEPGDQQLIYSSNRGGAFALWRVSIGGDAPQRVAVAARAADGPVMSRDGRRMVYEEWQGQTNIYALDTALTGATPAALTSSTRWDWSPAISPDGTRIAFASDRSGSAEVWVAARDGSEPLRLSGFGGPYTSGPAWSPDGATLVFDTPAVDGNFDLYTVGAQGGAPQRLTTDPAEDRFGHYSPDGSTIYFSSRRSGDWEIWRMPAAGGAEEQVSRGGAYFGFADAEGTLYYTRNTEPGLWRLKSGAEPEQVHPAPQPLDTGNWLLREGNVWLIERDGSEQPTLTRLELATGLVTPVGVLPQLMYKSGLSVGADGVAYYAQVVRSETDLMMMVRGD